jgi:hypothetical protein
MWSGYVRKYVTKYLNWSNIIFWHFSNFHQYCFHGTLACLQISDLKISEKMHLLLIRHPKKGKYVFYIITIDVFLLVFPGHFCLNNVFLKIHHIYFNRNIMSYNKLIDEQLLNPNHCKFRLSYIFHLFVLWWYDVPGKHFRFWLIVPAND